MIVARISEGLGNQLFQYAAGRNLAHRNGTDLVLDTSFYAHANASGTKRRFTLTRFNISAAEMSPENRPSFLPDMTDRSLWGKARRTLFRLAEYLKPLHKKKFIIEPRFTFCPDVLNAGPDCYLTGNWQSEKYFKDIEGIIRKEFSLREPLSPAATAWVGQIRDCNAVSVHIRRGDYVKNAKTNKLHGTTPLSYYEKATQMIGHKVPTPQFFVFSDDPAWVRANISIPHPTFFVSDGSIPDYEELAIMNSCKHHIIANSSFSWWGAWLNPNPDKIVVAPQKWFNAGTIQTSDLLPDTWVQM